MTSRTILQSLSFLRSPLAGILVLAGVGAGWYAPAASAKDVPLTAIELYDGPSGAAYVQLTDVLINGKAEMRDCSPYQSAAVDKSTYGRMGKVLLAVGGVLERNAEGVMHYSTGSGQPICVVPSNAKFEHSGAFSLSGLADQAVLRGNPIGSGNPLFAPPIKKGVKLLFVAAPNTELAEYLRAQRASDMDGWQAYLSKYPAAQHTTEAKHALASQFVAVGETAIQAYDKSMAAVLPIYSDLKTAKAKADKAHSLAPELASVTQLDKEISTRLSAIVDLGRSELDAYRAALADHSPGYAHLQNARKFSDIVAGIDSFYPPGQALTGDVLQDSNTFESAMQSADSAVTAKQFDQAYSFILPYRAFAEEEARVAAVVDAAYGYHLEQGNKQEQSEDWKGAIKEFQKAASIKDTSEAQDSLKNAQKQLVISQDKAAAQKALAASTDFQAQHNMIRAYEVLASLPASQQTLVADEMKTLEPAYVQAAAIEAKNLHQVHSPIRGLADEEGIEKAYTDLQNAYQLSENDTYKDKLDLDGNELSAYLLDQAKHYLSKPGGSGTELGWKYLEEARQYKASNLDAVRDAIVQASPAHAMRSKLSIRVQFRDQTSQRDSQGVAGQLENAIITGLESSGVPVKVVRAGETTAVEPDFELEGDVLDHHLSVVPSIEPQESEYRSGEEQIPSDAWNKINRDSEAAEEELKTAQARLEGAEASKKGSMIKQANRDVDAAVKKVQHLHELLDSTPKTVTRDIIRPYTYHKKVINITGVIQLQFRIENSLSEQRTSLVPISREEHKKDILLEDVKSEDTKGIKTTGTLTDPAEFMTALENSARDELIAAVRKKVEALPEAIYQKASGREKEDDLDGAGEAYLRFLNLTKEDNSVERVHAKQFLMSNFNMLPESNDAP
ncbi:MAG: hypothetical protein ACLQGT_11800 [Terracidiphilus sp.]